MKGVPARDGLPLTLIVSPTLDRAAYLKSAAGYIKPSGRFVVIDYRANQGPHKDQPELVVSEEQVTGWTRAAGLGKVEKVDMFPDIYFLVFSR